MAVFCLFVLSFVFVMIGLNACIFLVPALHLYLSSREFGLPLVHHRTRARLIRHSTRFSFLLLPEIFHSLLYIVVILYTSVWLLFPLSNPLYFHQRKRVFAMFRFAIKL